MIQGASTFEAPPPSRYSRLSGCREARETVALLPDAGNLVIRPHFDVGAVSEEGGGLHGAGAGGRMPPDIHVRRDEGGGDRQHRQGGIYVDELKRVLCNRAQVPRDVRYVPEDPLEAP